MFDCRGMFGLRASYSTQRLIIDYKDKKKSIQKEHYSLINDHYIMAYVYIF